MNYFLLFAPKGLETLTLEVWSEDIVLEIEQTLLESQIVLTKVGENSMY